jgi:hypothetical protein
MKYLTAVILVLALILFSQNSLGMAAKANSKSKPKAKPPGNSGTRRGCIESDPRKFKTCPPGREQCGVDDDGNYMYYCLGNK